MIDFTGICFHHSSPFEPRLNPFNLRLNTSCSKHYISRQLSTFTPQGLTAANMRLDFYFARSRPRSGLDRGGSVALLRRRYSRRDGRRLHNNILLPTLLHFRAVDPWRQMTVVSASSDLVTPLVVYIFDIEGVDVTGEVAGKI